MAGSWGSGSFGVPGSGDVALLPLPPHLKKLLVLEAALEFPKIADGFAVKEEDGAGEPSRPAGKTSLKSLLNFECALCSS